MRFRIITIFRLALNNNRIYFFRVFKYELKKFNRTRWGFYIMPRDSLSLIDRAQHLNWFSIWHCALRNIAIYSDIKECIVLFPINFKPIRVMTIVLWSRSCRSLNREILGTRNIIIGFRTEFQIYLDWKHQLYLSCLNIRQTPVSIWRRKNIGVWKNLITHTSLSMSPKRCKHVILLWQTILEITVIARVCRDYRASGVCARPGLLAGGESSSFTSRVVRNTKQICLPCRGDKDFQTKHPVHDAGTS